MKIKRSSCLLISISILLAGNYAFGQSAVNNKILPLGSDWAKNKGISLPPPYGISVFYTHMVRNMKVSDVTVEFQNQDPQSISDFSTFAVKNRTSVTAIKLDIWILPVLNLYVLGGYSSTDANLKANIKIDNIIPLPPLEFEIQTKTNVKGPYLGIGTSLVAGYKSWFILGDINYGETWPDKLNNTVNFTMLSARSGFQRNIGNEHLIRGWLGAIYMDSKSTLVKKEQVGTLGEVIIRVYQHPENPWTMQCGFMLSLSQRFEFIAELGTNFKDASISIVTASYRF